MTAETLQWLVPSGITLAGVLVLAGRQMQIIAQYRLQLKALHGRLDRIERLLIQDHEALIARGIIRPSQLGMEPTQDED
jgi:hypothetical protein